MLKRIIPLIALAAAFCLGSNAVAIAQPAAVTKDITAACSEDYLGNLLELPIEVMVAPLEDIEENGVFDADITGSITLDEDTVASIIAQVGTIDIDIDVAQVQVSAVDGATGSATSVISATTIDLGDDPDGNGIEGPFTLTGSTVTGTFTVTGAEGEDVVFDFDGDALAPNGIGSGAGQSETGAEASFTIFIIVINVNFPCESGMWSLDAGGEFVLPAIPHDDADLITFEIQPEP